MSEVECADVLNGDLVYRIGLAVLDCDCILRRDIAYSDAMSV